MEDPSWKPDIQTYGFQRIHEGRKEKTSIFFLYGEEIRFILQNNPCIQPHIVESFKVIIRCKIGMHHTYI